MKKTLILLIVAVVVVLGVVLIPESGNAVKTVSLPVLDLKLVDEVMLTKGGEQVLFKKDSESSTDWLVVTKDYKYPANTGKINALLNGFKSESVAEWVSGSEVYDRFGLGEEKIAFSVKASGEEKLNLLVGNRGSRSKSYYLRVSDDKNVYQLGGDRSLFDGGEKDFFNKQIIKLDPDLIGKISFSFSSKNKKAKNKNTVLTKSLPPTEPVSESNQVVEPKLDIWKDAKGKVYDNKAIIDVQNTLSNFKAVDFDDRKPSDYSSELLRVTMLANGKEYLVSIVEQKEDKTYVITTDDDRLSFVISELDGNRLLGLKDLKLKE